MKYIDISLENDIILTNPIDIFLQEITMQFQTRFTEVISEPGFGSDFETLLWDLTIPTSKIKKEVDTIINRCLLSNEFRWDSNVALLNGNLGDIILITINIYDENNKITKNYKITK